MSDEGMTGDWYSYGDVQRFIEAETEALRAKVEALEKDVEQLNNVLRQAGWGQGEIDSVAYTFDKMAKANTALVAERDRLKEAAEHCEKIFRSMADRGAYPAELLPFSTNPLTPHANNPHYLGKQGFRFLTDALRGEGK